MLWRPLCQWRPELSPATQSHLRHLGHVIMWPCMASTALPPPPGWLSNELCWDHWTPDGCWSPHCSHPVPPYPEWASEAACEPVWASMGNNELRHNHTLESWAAPTSSDNCTHSLFKSNLCMTSQYCIHCCWYHLLPASCGSRVMPNVGCDGWSIIMHDLQHPVPAIEQPSSLHHQCLFITSPHIDFEGSEPVNWPWLPASQCECKCQHGLDGWLALSLTKTLCYVLLVCVSLSQYLAGETLVITAHYQCKLPLLIGGTGTCLQIETFKHSRYHILHHLTFSKVVQIGSAGAGSTDPYMLYSDGIFWKVLHAISLCSQASHSPC